MHDQTEEQSTTRDRIAAAAAEVVAREGFDALSVRTVASVAGLAPGTVQHHFRTRDLLISGALDHVTSHQLARINALPRQQDMRQAIRIGILEILPFSQRSRDEAIVWLTLAAAAASRPSLRAARDRMVELFRGIVMDALRRTSDLGQSEAGIRTAAIVFAATIDGLILHAIDAGPDQRETFVAAVDRAIDDLFRT